MPKGIPLTEEEQNRRRHEIFAASLLLFVKDGFQETSMQAVAKASGLGKSTLYDYFQSKDEILVWGVEDNIIDLLAVVEEIAARSLPACERLKLAMKAHMDYIVANKELYLKLSFEVQRLNIESQKRIQIRRHAYQDMVCRIIEDGIREGAFRPVDALLVTRTLLTAMTPTVFTSRPSGTPQQMLDAALDIILRGIQA